MRLTAYIAAGLAGLSAGLAHGASVTEVNTEKKTVTVELAEEETFDKDAEVCFFSEDDKKIGCGKVSKVKGTAVTVKVKSAKTVKKITEGMTVKASDAAAEGEAPAEETAEEPGAKKGKKGKKEKTPKNPVRIIGVYNPAINAPFLYKKLAYAAPTTAAPETLWSQDKTIGKAMKDNPLSLTGQVAIPMGALSIAPGLRYRSFKPSLIDADYQPNVENPFVSTEMSATSIALFVDMVYYRGALAGPLFADLTAGLDIDNSTVKLTAKKKDDSGSAAPKTGDIGTAESKLTVVSLRVGAGMEAMILKIMGARLAFNLLVPVLETGATFSGKIADEESRGQADPGEDLKRQLDHKKNSLAFEIAFGGVLAF